MQNLNELKLEYKNNRIHLGDLWFHRPDKIHIFLSKLKFDLPPVVLIERCLVLIAKTIAELKSEDKLAEITFKTLDFAVQNILHQPRDCIINYSTAIGLRQFNKEVDDTRDLLFIHFTPNDSISKPKKRLDQIKAMRSCAMSFLKMIELTEVGKIKEPKYLVGVTNVEMANFAIKNGFGRLEDKRREQIAQKLLRSKNLFARFTYQQNIRLRDSTLNTVVYVESEQLKSASFKQKLIKIQSDSERLIDGMTQKTKPPHTPPDCL